MICSKKVFKNTLDQMIMLKISGKTIKSLIIDLS